MEKFVGKISDKSEHGVETAGARVIKLMDYLCDRDVCPILGKDGRLIYFDYGHFRGSFVRHHATYIDQIFRPEPGNATPTNGSPAQ
jgi:hypothetical protein